jgi:hypothetical protein
MSDLTVDLVPSGDVLVDLGSVNFEIEVGFVPGAPGGPGPKGDPGPAAWGPVAAWATGQNYTSTPPASAVTYGGETFVCHTSHTSGGAFDATKFTKIAQKGADGSGTGDMLGANNLSEITDPAAARSNLGAQAALGYTPANKAGDAFTGGISFGSVAAGSVTDLSKHLALYSNTYGFNVTASALNYNSNGIHNFLTAAGAARFVIEGTGARLPASVGNYLNFGSTGGSSGYGVRDNTGIIELKNSGDGWFAPMNKAGDVFSGDVSITKASPIFYLRAAASAQSPQIRGMIDTAARWTMRFGDGATESGGNAGSNFRIDRYDDAGTVIDAVLTIKRNTGTLEYLQNIKLAASKYLNWGSTDGSAGYGVRDNAGVIEVKNSGGAWVPLPSVDTTNASNLSSGTLPAARLPNPAVSTLGGVKSASAPANQVQSGIDTSGNPTFRALTASDLPSGAAATNLGFTPANKAGDSFTGGIGFGSVAAGAATDLSKHIALFSTTYGFSITGSTLNYVAPSAAIHNFLINGAAKVVVEANGVRLPSASSYLGFGTTSGASGYGVRDNAGVIEVKNSGGAWVPLPSVDTTNAANISSGTLPAARLPNPSAGALGGVKSASASANQFQTGIDTSGNPTFAQPAASNISGLANVATSGSASDLGTGTLPTARISNNVKTATIQFVIDGGGQPITTGMKGYLEIPFDCTIVGATLLADVSGSIVVDIFKDTYANFPPVVGDKITASAPPTISAALKSQNTTLTGWTTSITAGDILGFNVNSASTITRVTLSLKVVKT